MHRLNIKSTVLIVLATMLSVVVACKKDKNTIRVAGTLTDPNTAINVEGALVVFSAKKISGGVYNAGFEEISRATTDANGAFSFEMEEEYVSDYRFAVSKEGYFSYMTDIPASDIPAGTTYAADLEIYPIGYIILQTRNFAPVDTADFITYSFTSGYQNCYECCDNSARYGSGEDFADTLKCKTRGNQNVMITWTVTKNNLPTQHSATIYCIAHDTVTYQINY